MAIIKPFSAIFYNKDKVNLNNIIMPPYDIIRDIEQYYARDPYNIIRIDKGREEPGDCENCNKYTRAKEIMDKWLSEKILLKEDKQYLYVYVQDYMLPDGSKRQMIGFYARIKLEEFEKRIILPHERTHSGPKIDRLELMRQTKANTSPILTFFYDSKQVVNSVLLKNINKQPFLEASIDRDLYCKLWKVEKEKDIEIIIDFLKDKQLFIADGHHRYETALNFRNEVKQKIGIKGETGYDYIMSVLMDIEHAGITILPTHRIFKNFPDFSIYSDNIKKFFNISKVDEREFKFEMDRIDEKKLGIANKRGFYILKLKDGNYRELIKSEPKIKEYYLLSVCILHFLLFQKILQIPEEEIFKNIDYTQNFDEAIEKVKKNEMKIAFFVQPTTTDEIKIISLNNEVMPQKSTYFLPKLVTGLLINPLDEHTG
ncbi:MAG: DUF1015 domain-containing protein [Candidatus Goldbacteria bacterium]|nr:DUF1015 domain-containing protein [Candidatus Goldiibacteriota bacterium]